MQSVVSRLNQAFESILPHTVPYDSIIRELHDGIDQADFANVLLYGCEGIPHTVLWDIALRRKHGEFKRKQCVWEKQWIYSETPYFFEIDFMNPGQPKDIESLAEFFKDILCHPCIHATRHIFMLKHIDVLCTRGYVYMMRVILERFSKNAWFICTTYQISAIENPIRSRFRLLRVPLLTPLSLQSLFSHANVPLHEQCKKHKVTNVNVATFVSVMDANCLPYPVEDFCKFNAPFIQDLFKSPSASISQIRTVTQKLSVHGFSISQIAQDLLQLIHVKQQPEFIHKAAEIEYMYACTEKYRKPLYIELLLHTALYGRGNNPTKK